MDVLKYTLPEEITRNKEKAPSQNFTNTKIKDFFVFGQEKMVDFDNSINSFVGCCSLGTGHLDSFIKVKIMGMQGYPHCSKMIQDHKISLFLVEKCLQLNHHNQVKPT